MFLSLGVFSLPLYPLRHVGGAWVELVVCHPGYKYPPALGPGVPLLPLGWYRSVRRVGVLHAGSTPFVPTFAPRVKLVRRGESACKTGC